MFRDELVVYYCFVWKFYYFFSKCQHFNRTSYSVWKSGILKLSRSISKADIFTSHARAEIKK